MSHSERVHPTRLGPTRPGKHADDSPGFIRVTAPHFCAHADLQADGRVVPGGPLAPIIAYMRNWTWQRVQDYCARKGWEVARYDHSAAPL